MATVHQLLTAMQQQISAVTAGMMTFESPLSVQVGLLWPPVHTLEYVSKMKPPTALVSVYDRKKGHDATRWIPALIAQTVVTPGLTSTPSDQYIPPGSAVQITLGGAVVPGDAVSLVVTSRGSTASLDPSDGTTTYVPSRAVVYSVSSRDSPTSAAAKLAAAAAADPLSDWVQVSQLGAVLTVANLQSQTVRVQSFTGNGGTNTTEIGRRRRDLQITVWAPSPEIRDQVGAPVETLIAEMEVMRGSFGQFTSGLVLADGSFARVYAQNDYLVDDPVLAGIFRWDFVICADYPVTAQDSLYAVLAPITAYSLTA